MLGSKRRMVRYCRLSSTFPARRAIRPILCTSEICCSRYESQAQAESPLSTSFWKRSELQCGLRNESGGACRSATSDYLAKPESAAAAQSHDLEGGIERTLLARKFHHGSKKVAKSFN